MHFLAQIHPTFRLSIFLIGLLLLSQPTFAQKRPPKPQVTSGEKKACYRLSHVWKPEVFQGGNKRKRYYEGWYFKCVAADGKSSFALIPGIAMAGKGKKGQTSHAFIQFIDGETAETEWFEFPFDAFRYSQKRFKVWIGENYFSEDSIHLAIENNSRILKGDLKFTNLQRWPVRPLSPGIMGGYRFVPAMETCHGLLSMDHKVNGSLQNGQKKWTIENGSGYIEKDWGSSFPSSYVWMQSNGFAEDSASFMCSIATIPYLGKHFTGFLGYFWLNGNRYSFATYTHAKLEDLIIQENKISLLIRERKFSIEVKASRKQSGILLAPQAGQMERRISESVEAEIQLRVLNKKGAVIFEGIGKNAGLEIVGDTAELLSK